MTTLTGPQYYPGATHSGSSWYEDNYGGDAMDVNVLVIHTTEGTSLPTYGGGATAPNITFVPDFKNKTLRGYQHYRTDISSRALRNKLGGVATNTNNVTQAEFVGTCDPATRDRWKRQGLEQDRHFIFWPDAPDWALREMAEYVAWLHDNHGIPLVAPEKWPAYPSSFGNGQGQRMSGSQWNAFKGVCGHMHPPENDHGDPGDIPIKKILQYARDILALDEEDSSGSPTPTPKPTIPPFPGRKFFRAGANNKYVTQLGTQLKKKGFARRHDGDGYQPGPRWTEYDRLNVRDFQRSKSALRGDADGYPGPLTWKLLFS